MKTILVAGPLCISVMALFDLQSTVFTPSSEIRPGARAVARLAEHPAAIALSDLPIGGFATIHAVLTTDNDSDRDLVMRLIEIGFVPGERVRVIAQGRPGRQPIAVRLAATDSGRRTMSGSTFAMRRHEANFIRVVPDLPVGDV